MPTSSVAYKLKLKNKQDQITSLTRQLILTPKRNAEVYKKLKTQLDKAKKDQVKLIIAE